MPDYILAIIFGFVQGVTELLPISSSGHLLVFHEFFQLPIQNELVFDVFLHLATLAAIVAYFFQDIWRLVLALPRFFGKVKDAETALIRNVILATIPAAMAGWLWEEQIENSLRAVWVVIIMLAVVGVLFILIERKNPGSQQLADMSWRQASLIGLAQALALIPGTSRSGITILAALGLKYDRAEAARFSFLISIPIILGAVITKIPDLAGAFDSSEAMIWILASLSAFLSAFLAIKFLMAFVKRRRFTGFGVYRIVIALILLYIFYL